MKLVSKERVGSKVIKRYDNPKTPYQRLLESSVLSSEQKSRLRRTYVVKLKAEIDRLKERLWRLQKLKKNCPNFRIDSFVRQQGFFLPVKT
jgi:hypothetical protein